MCNVVSCKQPRIEDKQARALLLLRTGPESLLLLILSIQHCTPPILDKQQVSIDEGNEMRLSIYQHSLNVQHEE